MKIGKTSKGLTKEQTLMLSRASTLIFYFSHLHYVSLTTPKLFYLLIVQYTVSRNAFVLCKVMVEKSKQKDRIMGFITIAPY